MKKIILILSLLLTLSACVKTETIIELPTLPEIPHPQFVPFADPKGTVSQPDTQNYWVYNKIATDWNQNASETLSNGTVFNYNAYEYHGLKDKTVEDKINLDIKAMVDSFKAYAEPDALPAYAGLFKQYPKEGMVINTISVSTGSWFNYDNLLSVGVTATLDTQYPSAYEGYNADFQYTITKTFDLNTGDEVHLSDLFVNGTDYVTLINELVLVDAVGKTDPSPTYYEHWYQYNGGFSGIRGDINFALSPEGLILFFDHSYPEFFDEFTSAIVSIPFEKLKGVLAFQQRFASKTNLFTDTAFEKRPNYRTPISNMIDVVTKDQTTISKVITTDTTLSSFFVKLRNQLMAADQVLIDQAVKDKRTSVYYEFSAQSAGPYMNVISTLNISGDETYKYVTLTYKPDGSIFTFADALNPVQTINQSLSKK